MYKIIVVNELSYISDPWLEEREALPYLETQDWVCNLNVTGAFANVYNAGSFVVISAVEFRKASYSNKWLEE